MKVLIVTYYWPPSGGSGVQRWLKFVKYLQNFGIEPVVYTIANPNYPITDESLIKEIPDNITILKQPIWEPNNILRKFKRNKTQESAGFLNPNPSIFGKILQYIRANYFIPDARRFWINPSAKYLNNFLSTNSIDVVITTGPPHSLHLIGLELKKNNDIKWISDFRDPWTEIDYFEQLPLTIKSKKKHRELEIMVLKASDVVLVIGKTMRERYKKYSSSIHIITNGFDSKDINKDIQLDKKFTITHIGLMNSDRNPNIFWRAIKELADENSSFALDYKIQLVGEIANEVKESIRNYNLKGVEDVGYVLHDKVSEYQNKSQVLLLAVNNVKSAKGIITGKIFEYLQAKRPILAIGPVDGDLAEILNTTKSGKIFDFEDLSNLKAEILRLYNSYKENNLVLNSENIEQYHRKELTLQLSKILKETIS